MPTDNNTHRKSTLNGLIEAHAGLRGLSADLRQVAADYDGEARERLLDKARHMEAFAGAASELQVSVREVLGEGRLPESATDLAEPAHAVA